MAIARIDQNSEIYAKFNTFITAANKAKENDIFVQEETANQSFKLRLSAEDKIGKWHRSDDLKQANDNVRRIFKQTVLDMLGITDENTLDEEIRTALQLGDYGEGKPLSARRILAVNAEIQKIINMNVDKDEVNEYALDTETKIKNSITNNEINSLFLQTSNDLFRNNGRRPTENELEQFRQNPYAKVDLGGGGHFYMLNGKSFPMPDSPNDTRKIKEFAYSFLAEGLPGDRKISQDATLNLNVGDFVSMKDIVGDENVTFEKLANKLFGEGVSNAKTDFIDKFGTLPGVLGGGFVATEQGIKLVTKQERDLHQAMMYCSQQSVFSFSAAFLRDHLDFFGGDVTSPQEVMQHTMNVIRTDDGGYDIITRSKIPINAITGEENSNFYDIMHPPVVNVDIVFT